MIEKISELSVKEKVSLDSVSDDVGFLIQIEKKKEQEKDQEKMDVDSLPIFSYQPNAQNWLMVSSVWAGGAENQVAKRDRAMVTAPLDFFLSDKKGDNLRNQIVQNAAAKSQTAAVRLHQTTNSLGIKKNTATQTTVATEAMSKVNRLLTTAVKFQEPGVIKPETVNSDTTLALTNSSVFSSPHSKTGMGTQWQQSKEEASEIRPIVPQTRQLETVLPKYIDNTAQNKHLPAATQQPVHDTTTVVRQGNESKTLVVDYQFQRWAGDHSVKVSVPIEARRDLNVTLLPSDSRAADVLMRSMSNLTSLSPDLLRPQLENDEDQQHHRRQQQEQDEEME